MIHIQPTSEMIALVMSICHRTGLTPAELVAILTEIPDDTVSQYRTLLLAESWPQIFSAYLTGGYPACAEPAMRDLLARAYVVSLCYSTHASPSLLLNAATTCAATWQGPAKPNSLYAAAMLHEMADHMG